MPRRSGGGRNNSDDEEEVARKNPRRGAKEVTYTEETTQGDDPMDVDSSGKEESEEAVPSRRSSSRGAKKQDSAKENMGDAKERRTSSRATRFTSSMKEPNENLRDLLKDTTKSNEKASSKTTSRRKGSEASADDMDVEPETPKKRPAKRGKKTTMDSPHKSPARRSRHSRLSINLSTQSDDSDSSESDAADDEEDDEEELFKIQKILASRTEPKKKWKDIGKTMNTEEIDNGSRWVQDGASDDDDDDAFEERFLVKWSDASFLHVSWETESDLLEQVEGAKTYLSTFFRKSEHGLLFDSDERCDGDYFDPAWTQIDRILDLEFPEQCPIKSVKDEDNIANEDLGIVLDKSSPQYEKGFGREFLVKWGNCPYSEATWEFERDLILNDVEYKEHLKSFNQRRKRPTKDMAKKLEKKGEAESRRLYKSLFGDNSDAKEEEGVEEYQRNLQERVYKNGGQLRDYQSVGVSWLMANLVNKRSSILADEMGLGKTLQTASFINLIATTLNKRGPFLIVAPLSTLAHWQREFMGWTDLNTIVYHGSAKDRELIRELEISHESLRPQGGVGFNQLYLRKCLPKRNSNFIGNPWMAEVVITTPELICADDFLELTAVKWECLVVDEAQKLKNHNSKLATNLRDAKFHFGYRLLLTGTPIQNSMEELFALLNFIDPDRFEDCDDFLEKYGDIKSKEKIDELHEEIRPYILRRLKEDAEKSVPPKEETVIEVELTVAQKQYYRALYEKNVKFLHKDKKKALDGPSLNNLAMQLRKCCNHLFLLNGIEETFREQQKAEGVSLSEGDLLVKASGKLVLLDKLLPRLKENGHRILIFSQFKIMLDVIEDFCSARVFKFERIDGSITGKKRQQAIDRFQRPDVEGKEQPFIMLLSTRAGGVGINLTAADTCIIFDSDWNPQNDLQAQARCHRIGQTKNVKVFRLLTRNTYELQMFHMSSMKMGLDQAVLSGFESGAQGEGALSKDEVEKLLRHGAYGIFSEDKDGADESNAFVQQDIDTILERRARTVVHENTGSKSSAAGGTFSKARFAAHKGGEGKKAGHEDVALDDPDFWKKMVGEGKDDDDVDDLTGKRRKRTITNYSEGAYEKRMEQSLLTSDIEADDDEDEDSEDDESYGSGDEAEHRERFRWGGAKPSQWKHDEAKKLLTILQAHGYGTVPWSRFVQEVAAKNGHSEEEIRRMCWSLLLVSLCEVAEDDAAQSKKRAARAAEKKRDIEDDPMEGGVLAAPKDTESSEDAKVLVQKCFDKLWLANASWAASVIKDALQFARNSQPRSDEVLSRVLRHAAGVSAPMKQDEITTKFVQTVWPSLKNRGWKAQQVLEGANAGKTQYSFEGKQYFSPESVLAAAGTIHSELSNMVESMLSAAESSRQRSKESEAKLREKHLAMKAGTIDLKELSEFLSKYAPLQVLFDRKHHRKLALSARKMMHACTYMHTATALVRKAEASRGSASVIEHLSSRLAVDKRQSLPHPLWTLRHDAVLIHAIAKHGWIDNDWSSRRIINDSEIVWGFPFDSEAASEQNDGNKTSQKEDLLNSLRETAHRAVDVFNDHHDTLQDVKNFNQALVIRTFSLVHLSNDDTDVEMAENERPKWAVDDEALVASTGLDSSESQDVELPPKRDLSKRIKHILQKNATSASRALGSASSCAPDIMHVDSKGESQGFCVIDQSDRCNTLLAEILRAIVKAPYPKSQNAIKLLCAIACEEATKRKASILAKPDAQEEQNKKRTKAAEEMSEAVKNIGLAKRFLKLSRQAKNVIRAMIGVDVVKHPKDPVFPVEGPMGEMGSLQKAGGQSGSKHKKEDAAVGDRALARAIARCYERHGGGPGRVLPEGHSSDLELTAIETLIITVICSQGLPVWTEDMSALLVTEPPQSSGNNSHRSNLAMDWIGLGSILASAAKDWHETASRKVEVCQHEYKKHEEKPDESQSKTRARKNLANAIRIADVKETAASQAAEYAEDPHILAQKTVMLIERLRRKMGNTTPANSKTTKKSNHWLGPKVFDFLSGQLSRWANVLDIVDGAGTTLSYTAADFYHDLPDDEKENVEVTANLNKQDCRQLLIQITLVTRLRSLFVKYPKDDLLPKIDSASRNSKVGDAWEAQPDWWTAESPSHYDALLLESIVEFGFGGVLENARGFGPPDKTNGQISLKDLGLTRATIQQRANQLARELHNLERTDDAIRAIEGLQTKAKGGSKKGKSKNDVKKGGKKGNQTAIHSFFAKTGNGKKSASVVELSDGEDGLPKPGNDAVHIVEIDMSPQQKDGGNQVAALEPEGVTLSGEKRESPETSSSPEKKLRAA